MEPAIMAMRPVPASVPEPEDWPTDRSNGAAVQTVAAQEPLPWSPPVNGRARDATGPPLVRRLGTDPVRVLRYGDSWAPRMPPRLPDPGDWCVRLGAALLEAVQGLRPVTQLNRWLDPIALADLTVHIRRRPDARPILRSVHLSRPAAEAVEAVAIFGWTPVDPSSTGTPGTGCSTAALAFRLEARDRRWMCTRLDTRPLAGNQEA